MEWILGLLLLLGGATGHFLVEPSDRSASRLYMGRSSRLRQKWDSAKIPEDGLYFVILQVEPKIDASVEMVLAVNEEPRLRARADDIIGTVSAVLPFKQYDVIRVYSFSSNGEQNASFVNRDTAWFVVRRSHLSDYNKFWTAWSTTCHNVPVDQGKENNEVLFGSVLQNALDSFYHPTTSRFYLYRGGYYWVMLTVDPLSDGYDYPVDIYCASRVYSNSRLLFTNFGTGGRHTSISAAAWFYSHHYLYMSAQNKSLHMGGDAVFSVMMLYWNEAMSVTPDKQYKVSQGGVLTNWLNEMEYGKVKSIIILRDTGKWIIELAGYYIVSLRLDLHESDITDVNLMLQSGGIYRIWNVYGHKAVSGQSAIFYFHAMDYVYLQASEKQDVTWIGKDTLWSVANIGPGRRDGSSWDTAL